MSLLCLDQVSLAYEGHTVLSQLSLRIEERDFLVLRGRNGGGKSTLLKHLVGLLPHSSGRSERAEGLRVGYLPQYRNIDRDFPLTVEDCVCSGLQSRLRWWQRYGAEHRALTADILARLGIAELAQRPISALSGGQWQRTLLARALVSSPQLLLLDEPDAHLDQASKQELYATLLREHSERAIVIVSHDERLPLPPDARVIDLDKAS